MYSIDSNDVLQWGIVIGILYPIGMSWYLWREWNKLKGDERNNTKDKEGV